MIADSVCRGAGRDLPASPRILVVGEWQWPWYQEACSRALSALGCGVVKFGWLEQFKKWLPGTSEPVYRSLAHRLQFRFLQGPVIWRLNHELTRHAIETQPDIVWFYNVHPVTEKTVIGLRRELPKAIFCQYANDNPFSPRARSTSMWRHFLASIPHFHMHYAYRPGNLADFARHRARSVHLLRSYFIPEDESPLEPAQILPRFRCDAVFAGHYENDGRVGALESVCRAGFKLNLFGGGWNAALPRLSLDSPLRALYPVVPVTGMDYRQALCGAKVALCFLSKLNEDTYTRRNFQIPAMKVAMLSEHSGDLAEMFRENHEAAFFRSNADLLEKMRWLLGDDTARQSIAEAGFRRVYQDGHDVDSRMRQWLQTVREF